MPGTRPGLAAAVLSRLPSEVHLVGSHGNAESTKTFDDLYRVCEEFKKERIDVLGISGGDGTLHHTLTAMIQFHDVGV